MITNDAMTISKSIYASFGRGDLDAVIEVLADEIVWELVGPKTIPYFDRYAGKDGVRQFFARLFESEEILEFEPIEWVGNGDKVVVLGREKCRSRKTGREFKAQWAHIFEAKNGKLVSWTEIIDTAPIVQAFVDMK